MALHPIHSSCPYCQHPFNETPSRSFLGFQKISCPACNENLTYPLSSGFRTTYRVLVIVILLVNLLQGRIGFPGIIGIAMCYALFRDWKLRKELNFD